MIRFLPLFLTLMLSLPAQGQVFEPILNADFADKPLGEPIGTGGAALGEPVSWDPGRMATEVIAATAGRALSLTRLDTPESTAATSMRFGFLDDQELTSGQFRISLQLTAEELGAYALRIREAGGSAVRWIDVEFQSTGSIRRQVGSGLNQVVGSYLAGQPIALTLAGDFEAGSYAILMDGESIDSGSFTPGTRGVGSLLISFLPGSVNFDKTLIVDEVRVEVAVDRLFRDRFE